MILKATQITGCYIIEPSIFKDERGAFSRIWCADTFQKNNLNANFVQSSTAFNSFRGTIRGLHYQRHPFQEAKLVRCSKGSIFDVVVDLRPDSSTYGNWIAMELSEKNYSSLYIPEGCAHGYQTLGDACEVSYCISNSYSPEHASGILWNDSVLNINWPLPLSIISEKDTLLPAFAPFLG